MTMEIPSTPGSGPVPSWDECLAILERLPSLSAEARAAALELLVRNPSPGIREQVLRIGAAVLPDAQVTAYLRNDADAVLRNAASEILRLRGGRSLPLVTGLLHDPDPDVVLQAVLILDRLRDPRALEPLHAVLAHPDPNVQQEAILAIGHLGDARSIPYLLPFLDGEPWVQMAAVQALGDLRSPEAVVHLATRLADDLVGSLAAEALARIGGEAALLALTDPWPMSKLAIDEEILAGLLAHVLEGLAPAKAQKVLPAGFPSLLAARFDSGSSEQRTAISRCLLILGPSPWDEAALTALAAAPPVQSVLPAALAWRHDLAARLLGQPGERGAWGFLLAARFPDQVPAAALVSVLAAVSKDWDHLPALAQALTKSKVPGLGEPLLDLYLRAPAGAREVLEPVLAIHRVELQKALKRRPAIEAVDRLALAAQTGTAAGELLASLLALPAPGRPAAVSRLLGCEELVRALPWERWVAEEPEIYGPLAADAAGRYALHDLGPVLRAQAAATPSAPLLRALGELADRDAVPLLVSLLDRRRELRLVGLESLGKIGGPEARAALRAVIAAAIAAPASGPELRVAYRALAGCATAEDEALFLQAAIHTDWYVRLAAVDGLGRSPHLVNAAALARLAGDPVQAVAHRALTALESRLGREE